MKSYKPFRFYVLLNCLIVGIFLLSVTSQSMADTHCVANANDLIAALDDANDNGADDLIKIQQGTYNGNFVYASIESFGVTIEGGYSEGCGSRDVDFANTVLDGGENGAVLALSAPEVTVNFVVDGLTLQNGRVTGDGGGLFIKTDRGNVTVTNNSIINNSASNNGGGVLILRPTVVTLTNNNISNNTGGGGAWNYGGGVHIETGFGVGTVQLNHNTINHNYAWKGGGIFLHALDLVTMTSNTINGNNSYDCGGGVHINTVNTVTLTNNVISNNGQTWNGGGVYFFSTQTTTMTNNTVIGNSAGDSGGGIWIVLRDDNHVAKIFNNIFWNNSVVQGEGADLFIDNDEEENYKYSIVNLYNNDFDHSSGFFITEPDFPIDPSNLDKVDPSFVDPPNDDYHLKEDSVLINAGNNLAPELPATDKDGNPRIMDGIVDMGAYEYPGAAIPVIDSFTASPTSGEVPLSVTFACVARDFGGSIDTYTLDYGDGSSQDNTTGLFNYDYVTTGTYDATCTVVDNDGESNVSDPLAVNVTAYQNRPPVADAGTYEPVFDMVILDGSLCDDPDGTIEHYAWKLHHMELGDDIFAEGELPTVSGLVKGFYEVSLIITDNEGAIGEDNTVLPVAGPCEDLDQCLDDLEQCQDDTELCNSDLSQCNDDLIQASGDLTTCSDDLGQCEGNLLGCQTASEQCNSNLTLCNDNLSQAMTNLEMCNENMTQLQEELEKALDDLAAATTDTDVDGVLDLIDACPGSASGSAVDQIGCSLVQFCSSIDTSSHHGRKICERSDWENDEPLKNKGDCKSVKQGRGSHNYQCVPR